MDNQASYEAMQQAWGQQEPSGLMGLLNSPMGQALLGAGLGALSSSGSTAQAIGRGGLLGLSAFSQAQDKQENRLLQMAQAKMRDEALASLSPREGGGYTGDISKLLRYMTPDQVQSTFNLGRNKLRQMQEVTNADGSKSIYAIDDYGDTRDTGLMQAPEITKQDLGGRVVGLNAHTGAQAWGMDKTPTFAELDAARHNRANESVQYGTLGLARDRLAFDKTKPSGPGVNTPAGAAGEPALVHPLYQGSGPPGLRPAPSKPSLDQLLKKYM